MSMPRSMSDRKKRPSVSRDARTARILVLPATPLPPQAVVVPARRSGRSRTCRGPRSRSRRARPDEVSTVRLIWPANSGWFTSRPVSTTATRRLRAAAHGGDRLAGTHGVVRPGELDAAARGRAGRTRRPRPRPPGRARRRPRAGRRAERGHGGGRRRNGRGDHAGTSRRSVLAPSAGARPPPRPCRRACARPRADEPARPSGRSGRARRRTRPRSEAMRSGLRQRKRHHAGAGGARLRPERGAQLLALDHPCRRLRGRSKSGAAQRSPASTALRTRAMVGAPASFRRPCSRRSTSGRST